MTGPFATLMWTLLAAVGFDPPPWYWANLIYSPPPDTPSSDIVILRSPYAVAKDHSLGPNAPTELIDCDKCHFRKCGFSFAWVRVDGLERSTIRHDAHLTAVVGTWLVVQDRQGKCFTYDLSNRSPSSAETDLAGLNAHLASVGAPPVSDADFRTFEELVEERNRRQVKWSLVGLAVTLLPLAGGVLVAMVRSRSNADPGRSVHS